MKRFGVSAFDEPTDAQRQFTSRVFQRQSQEYTEQLRLFQDKLVEFSKSHNDELRSNPEVRSKFLQMCATIGIDPLELFDKDRHLFTVNDFYYEICVKLIQICRDTRDINGGIISLNDLQNLYFKNTRVTSEDIEKVVEMLSALEGGFEIITLRNGQMKFLRSVPNELTSDQTKILEICSILGYASISLLTANLDWERDRSKAALEGMVANGLLWIDEQSDGLETLYWDPSWITRTF